MSLPIAIPSLGERLTVLERNNSFDSVSSFHDKPAFTRSPSRPSVLTNKLSPNNAIPSTANMDPKSPTRILTTLPSIRNTTPTPQQQQHHQQRPPSRSMTSTPDLSHSTMTSQSNTPLLSPELTNMTDVPCLGLGGLLGSQECCSKRAELVATLKDEDRYLLYLRDEAGIASWERVAEMMREKGFPTPSKGLRTRYFTLRRDIDVSLREAIERLHSTQNQIDTMLGSQNCRVRRLASCNKKKVGGGLRVFEESPEESPEEVDPVVWSELAAKLRASGLR